LPRDERPLPVEWAVRWQKGRRWACLVISGKQSKSINPTPQRHLLLTVLSSLSKLTPHRILNCHYTILSKLKTPLFLDLLSTITIPLRPTIKILS